jgi:hypothetical protein
LSTLDAKIVTFPPAEHLPKPSPRSSPDVGVPRMAPQEADGEKFRGGSLRGLFWALLLEAGMIALGIGAVLAWHTMHP